MSHCAIAFYRIEYQSGLRKSNLMLSQGASHIWELGGQTDLAHHSKLTTQPQIPKKRRMDTTTTVINSRRTHTLAFL